MLVFGLDLGNAFKVPFKSKDVLLVLPHQVCDMNIFRFGSSQISVIVSSSFLTRIIEAEEETESPYFCGIIGDLYLGSVIPVEEDMFLDGGFGDGRRYDRDGGDGGRDDRSEIGEYYERVLKANPDDALLLRNYNKYLHERNSLE